MKISWIPGNRDEAFKIVPGMILFAAFLLAAPLWAPFIQVVYDRRTFLEADSMQLWGAALLLGLVCSRFLSDRFIFQVYGAAAKLRKSAGSVAVVISLLVILLTVWINKAILHSFMSSADEHSCLFLAECFRLGKWWVKPHALSEFFNVVHVGNRDGRWFSVYPPGWPLIMTLGLRFQILDLLNPVMTGIATFFIYLTGKELFGRGTALLAILLTAATAFYTFTAASYFSHSTSLLCMSLFAYAFVRWTAAETEEKRLPWAVMGALAVGYGLSTRYLTMAAFAAPFLICSLWPVITRKRALRKSEWIAAGIMLFFLLLVLYQNYAVTGKPFKAPNRFDKSWERLGFNENYNPIDGTVFVFARFFYLMDWVPPIWPMLFLAVFIPMVKAEKVWIKKLFIVSFFFPAAAYFLYFSWGGNQFGPRYWYEGFPFMMLAVSAWFTRAWSEGSRPVRGFLIGLVLASVFASAWQFYKQGEFQEEASRQRKAVFVRAEAEAETPAIVFIKGFLGDRLVMAEDDAIRNTPSLNTPIVYAHDLGERNVELRKYFKDRHFYRASYDREAKAARLERLPL